MHKAPSVTYPVGPCAWYGRVLWSALAVVALSGVGGAVVGQAPSTLGLVAATLLGLCAAWAVARHLSRVPMGRLMWRVEDSDHSPGEWVWLPDQGRAALVSVRVAWSGSSALGLRLVDGLGQTHWVWAQAQHAREEWLPFRRALISSCVAD